MNKLSDLTLLERMEQHPFLNQKIARFVSQTSRRIRELRKSDLQNKQVFLDAYVFHRSHQFSNINMDVLDDETKHEMHCRVMALLVKKAIDNES